MSAPVRTLVLGGARAGKSRYAQQRAEDLADRRVFLATATASDPDMAERIARHQADRGPGWETVEEHLALPAALTRHADPDRVVVVDCLTLWLSNLLAEKFDPAPAVDDLVGALRGVDGPVLVVSNELGMGVHPPTELGRRFRDEHGRMNQTVAAAVEEVVLVVAGMPLRIR